MKTEDSIEWAVGVIEGEGSFSLSKHKHRKNSYKVAISLSTTDEDVARRIKQVFNVGHINGPYLFNSNPLGKKPQWRWEVQKQKDVFDILLKIGPLLSKRRSQQAGVLFRFLESKICA